MEPLEIIRQGLKALADLMDEPSTTLIVLLFMWCDLEKRLKKLEKRRCYYARSDLRGEPTAGEEPPEVGQP